MQNPTFHKTAISSVNDFLVDLITGTKRKLNISNCLVDLNRLTPEHQEKVASMKKNIDLMNRDTLETMCLQYYALSLHLTSQLAKLEQTKEDLEVK